MEILKRLRLGKAVSIRWKLLAIIVIVIACVVAVAAVAVSLQLRSAGRAAALEADHVATAIAKTGRLNTAESIRTLQTYVADLGKVYERDIAILDRAGIVVAGTNPAAVGTLYAHADVQKTLRDGVTRTFEGPDISSFDLNKQVVVPLRRDAAVEDSPVVGVVLFEYALFYDTLMQEAAQAATLTSVAALILLGLGVLLAGNVVQSILQPLQRLRQGVRAISAGYFDVRVHVDTRDELGHLADAFNGMAKELEDSHSALQTEIHKQKAAAQRIEYLAYNDQLTGLPNRTMFSVALNQALHEAHRHTRRFALLFVDLDRFKHINDTLGHATGDVLLKDVAVRLGETLRAGDMVARLGGDEFVVLIKDLQNEKHAEIVADKILAAIAKPLLFSGHELRVTCSVGVSIYPGDGEDAQTLMKNADIAMYQAKEKGRNHFSFYSAERNVNTFERLALETSLRRAVDRDELLLHYQPKMDFRHGGTSGMEALLRWQHPEMGMVSPAQFIPLAEETGLIVPIGMWVLRTACRQMVQWREKGFSQLVISVNLSPRQFSDTNLLEDIAATLAESGLDGRCLELEITESAIMQDVERGRKLLMALKAMGIRIAVDDFGTGYSSLSTLKQFPIDTLKIDRSFIRDLATDAEDRGLTEAIIAMGKALKLHLVAEGVETQEQLDFLRERGCDELQGYHYSRPLPGAQFEAFVLKERANHSMRMSGASGAPGVTA